MLQAMLAERPVPAAPEVNVNVPITMPPPPKSRGERTVVTEHDENGRIKSFERHQIE